MAVSSLEKFKSVLSTYGTARANLYMVDIAFPQKISHLITTDDKVMTDLYCELMDLPPKNIMSSPVRQEHATWEHPYGISYEPLTLNFYLDRKMILRRNFVNWYNFIYGSGDNGFSFYNDYASTITLSVLDKKQDSYYSMILLKAYPKSIGNVQFSASSEGQVATMPVQFVYERIIE